MRTQLATFFIGMFFALLLLNMPVQSAEPINIDDKQVVYPLPYPGILADHPLYTFKEWRDNIIIFTTRDNTKKAQLYLHLSDKHMAIALDLSEKGKETLAKEELLKAEDQFLMIPPLLKEAKEQGEAPSNDFLSKLAQSNEKHRDVIAEVMKNVNVAEIETFNTVLEKNSQAAKDLRKI